MQHSTLKIAALFSLTAVIVIGSCNQPITYPAGGYDYPAKDSVTDTNFYFYPLRNVLAKRDSFRVSSAYILYNAFDEPNLSIKPMEEDVFRFEFEGFKIRPTIITFTKDEMDIKTGGNQYVYDYLLDENRLTPLEKRLYHFFEWHGYPYYDSSNSERSRRVDSMIKTYPQLLDLKYFKYLENKTKIPNTAHYEYNIKKIHLPSGEYKRLVSLINNSGYWKLPYSLPTITESMDGYGFSPEANTKTKYNFVTASCDSDPKNSFFSICGEIVKCAGLEKQIGVFSPEPQASTHKPIIVQQDVTLADIKQDSSSVNNKPKNRHDRKKSHRSSP